MDKRSTSFFWIIIILVGVIAAALYLASWNPQGLVVGFTIVISVILIVQGLLTIIWMGYAWEDPEHSTQHAPPQEYYSPRLSFTALLPARHEESVIRDTIEAVDRIDYPDHLKEILVICREDDTETIAAVQETIDYLDNPNINLVVFDGYPINKPHSLNHGLKHANHEVVCIFDAEDEPHPEIYNVVNATMIRDEADVVQSGVQLINFQSQWFSAFNVLEYYFWFKSGLPFFSTKGEATLLGGNTVFFKKDWLDSVDGWDQENLTEDADLALRLASKGAKIRVVYEAQYATQEETPSSVEGFIKQRTRWNQGFLQTILKGDWKKLPKLRQRLTILFMLFDPFVVATLLLYLPVGIWLAFTQRIPVGLALFTFVPLQLLIAQLIMFMIGLRDFAKAYNLEYPTWMPLKLLVTFYPYQFLLMASALRAAYRMLAGRAAWEKTAHANLHRGGSSGSVVRSPQPRPTPRTAPAWPGVQPAVVGSGTGNTVIASTSEASRNHGWLTGPEPLPVMTAVDNAPRAPMRQSVPNERFRVAPDRPVATAEPNPVAEAPNRFSVPAEPPYQIPDSRLPEVGPQQMTFMLDIDMTLAEAFLDHANQRLPGGQLPSTMTAVIVKAVAWALNQHPSFNSYRSNGQVIRLPMINVGVTVALEEEVVIPVIQQVHHKGLLEISKELADLSQRAHQGKLTGDDVSQGTFTLTDLSMFGVDRFAAAVVEPQVAVVAAGQINHRFVPDENKQPVVRPIMTFTLSADPHAINDAQAAHFMATLRDALEDPTNLLL